MKVSFTGEEISILKTILLRPTDGATPQTLLSILRLKEPLRLDEDLEGTEEFSVDLEDQDIKFIKGEWASVNTKPDSGIFVRGFFTKEGSLDSKTTFQRMEKVIALDKKIKGLSTERE